MPYDLKISMTGLGVFAQDKNAKVHFLMPQTGSMHAHEACLLYDAAHVGGGSPNLGMVTHSLGGRILDLSAVGVAGDVSGDRIHPSMLDLSDLLSSPLKGDLLDEPYEKKDLYARVTLYTGSVSCAAGKAIFNTQKVPNGANVPKPVPFLMEWTIPDLSDGTSPVLTLRRLSGGSPLRLPQLQPVDEAGLPVIRLWIFHVPIDQMPPLGKVPPKLNQGDPAPHLSMAYGLFASNPTPLPTVKFDSLGDPPNPLCSETRPLQFGRMAFKTSTTSIEMGDEYTCAGGKGSIA